MICSRFTGRGSELREPERIRGRVNGSLTRRRQPCDVDGDTRDLPPKQSEIDSHASTGPAVALTVADSVEVGVDALKNREWSAGT